MLGVSPTGVWGPTEGARWDHSIEVISRDAPPKSLREGVEGPKQL